MQSVLVLVGIVCVIAAIVGGGVKIANHSIERIDDVRRQVLLALAGVAILVFSFNLPSSMSEGGSPVSGFAGWVKDFVPDFTDAETEILVRPDSGERGDLVKLSGRGFKPGEMVKVSQHGTVLTTVRADSNGEIFEAEASIPSGAVCFSKQCRIGASGVEGGRHAETIFTLTSGPDVVAPDF